LGRGRSKAKQTKVARDLKYSNHEMDLERLAEELHGEKPEEKSFIEQDTCSEDQSNDRN
jgi:hypothetical protein